MLLNVGRLCGQQMLNSRHFSNCLFRESFPQNKDPSIVRGILMKIISTRAALFVERVKKFIHIYTQCTESSSKRQLNVLASLLKLRTFTGRNKFKNKFPGRKNIKQIKTTFASVCKVYCSMKDS